MTSAEGAAGAVAAERLTSYIGHSARSGRDEGAFPTANTVEPEWADPRICVASSALLKFIQNADNLGYC